MSLELHLDVVPVRLVLVLDATYIGHAAAGDCSCRLDYVPVGVAHCSYTLALGIAQQALFSLMSGCDCSWLLLNHCVRSYVFCVFV